MGRALGVMRPPEGNANGGRRVGPAEMNVRQHQLAQRVTEA
jgi:hypothetical protein